MARNAKFGPKMSIDGLRELDAALEQLGKVAAKAILRRVAKVALKSTELATIANAPGNLKNTIKTSPTVNKNQRKFLRRNAQADQKAFIQMHVGSTAPHAHLIEFGTSERFQYTTGRDTGQVAPQPFMRSAWVAEKAAISPKIAALMWADIEKTAARAARKRAKMLAKAPEWGVVK